MPGVRIHHPTLTNAVLIVPHPGDPATGRRPKDYHVRLDSNGDAIVSETVWDRLQQARGSGLSDHAFIVLGEVADPPPLIVGGDPDRLPAHLQEGDVVREILGDLPPGTYFKISDGG